MEQPTGTSSYRRDRPESVNRGPSVFERHSIITQLCFAVIYMCLLALAAEVGARFLFPTINFVGESGPCASQTNTET